jgi:hypothetical protein
MTRVLSALAIGILLGGAGVILFLPEKPKDAGDCSGLCGEGTVCEDGRCVVAKAEAPEAPEGKKKRKGKRRRKGTGDPGATGDLPPFEPMSDSHIPAFDPKRTEKISMQDGTERLSDRQVQRTMSGREQAFNDCIATAAMYSETELGSGSIDFTFSVEGSGKVSSVTAKAPSNLDVWGIVPCLRNAVSRTKFPARDGPTMGVDYSFDVR